MFDVAVEALTLILVPERLMWLLIGVTAGLVVGLIPGLGGTVGMSILLPFVFGMDPISGVALLIGMIAVTTTSDTFPSVLMGVPGSSAAQATIMDGYPLARQGQAKRALGASFFSSMVGGVFGALVLFAALGIVAPVILSLGSPELFMMTLLGLSVMGMLARESRLRGILSGGIGLALGTIGVAPAVAEYRFTFGEFYFFNGIPLPILALGLFAVPEILDLLTKKESIARGAVARGRLRDGVADAMRNKLLILRSSLVGVVIGIIPGFGGSVANWVAYSAAQRTSKNSENFGNGDIRGVVAPESANNATDGGSLVPTLFFGIPGGAATAILMGGMLLLGIRPGPEMLSENLDVTLSVMWTLVLANVIACAACMGATQIIVRITTVPAVRLMPFILIIVVLAAYQSSRNVADILTFLAIGLVGVLMKRFGWPRPPLLVGFVLAISAERYLHLSVSRYGYEWITSPIVLGIGAVIFALVAGPFVARFFKGTRAKVLHR